MSYNYLTQYNSPNYTPANEARSVWGRARTIEAIAIHHWGDPNTNPTFEGVINVLCNPSRQASAHFVATGTGRRVACLVNIPDASWATNSANPYTISIECDPRCRDEDYDVVAEMLQQLGFRPEVVAAGILHDVVEDTTVTLAEITESFGPDVSALVEMVTDVSKPSDGNRRVRKAIDREHLRRATVEGKSIKLADLISNAKTLVPLDPSFAHVWMSEKRSLLTVLADGGHPVLLSRAQEIVNKYFSEEKF
jgi:hypothetical protein